MNGSMGKKISALLLVLVLAFSLAACGNKEAAVSSTPAATEAGKATATPAAADAAKTQYPLKLKDVTGAEFTFDKAPERIVSISPAETESLFALGVGDKVVGVSDYDDYPAEAKSKPKMGGVVTPNAEAILAANADIVFTGISLKAEATEKLRGLGIKVFKVDPKTVDDVIANITLYGQITDHAVEALKITDKIKADRQKVTDAVKGLTPEQKKKVYLEFSPGWTVGKGEFIDELITLSGAVNVAADMKGWNQINEEQIIQKNPNVILYATGFTDDKTKKTIDQLIHERSGWDKIDAIQKNQVIGLDTNTLVRPGPRISEGLLSVAKAIYPELVK
jgi:iron complex transport system substrate-binding protein